MISYNVNIPISHVKADDRTRVAMKRDRGLNRRAGRTVVICTHIIRKPSPYLTDSGMFVYQSEIRHILIDYLITNTLMQVRRYRTTLKVCLINLSRGEILMNKRCLPLNTPEINQRANVFGTYLKCVYFQSHIFWPIKQLFLIAE